MDKMQAALLREGEPNRFAFDAVAQESAAWGEYRGAGRRHHTNMTQKETKDAAQTESAPAETERETDGAAAQKETKDAAQTESAPAETECETFRKSGFRYGCYLFVKRTFDFVSSLLMLILLSWLILLCILIKWLEDFHNPIYVSRRVGKDGKIFKFYKIRTMCPHAEQMKQKLIDEGLNEADGPAFKMKNDPRITRVGKLYRKLSLDELPQLFNILNGSMSVVGPRPPIPSEVEQYTPYQRHRLDVKGGLLCLWQIQKNRNALDFDEWIKLDLEYIRKQSVWLDLKIIFKGAYMVVFDRSGE